MVMYSSESLPWAPGNVALLIAAEYRCVICQTHDELTGTLYKSLVIVQTMFNPCEVPGFVCVGTQPPISIGACGAIKLQSLQD